MSSNVFYDGLNEFCRKYFVAGVNLTSDEIAKFPVVAKEIEATLFENLLLFDKVSLKVFGENIPLVMLLNLFGEKGLEELVEQGAIDFVLWTPMVLFLKENQDESPRVLRRLLILREWSHEQDNQVFPRSTRARRAHGARASQRVSIPMVGH